MKYPAYPEYKDSGVEWIGKFPAHWTVKRHKYLAKFSKGRNPSKLFSEPFKNAKAYLSTDFLRGKSEPSYAVLESGCSLAVEGQPLLIWDGSNAGEFLIGKAGIVSSTMASATIISDTINADFYEYVCKNMEKEIRTHATGMGIPHVDGDELYSVKIPIPGVEEQILIVNFLRREVSKINELMAKQEKLIGLLREQRQAVVSHAVTKGLNQKSPMNDTGVEWLGQAPEHWKVIRYKVIYQDIDERSEDSDGELMTVSHITGVTPRSEKNVNMFLAETLEGYKKCRRGDLVINTMWAWMGALGISPCDGLVSPSYNVYRLRKSKQLYHRYYDYYSRTPQHISVIKAWSTGVWESRLRLYPDVFLDLKIALPPYDEQMAIVEYLDKKTAHIDTVIEQALKSIALMEEHRSALISAAVTGKIDVRSCVSNAVSQPKAMRDVANDNSLDAMLFAVVASSLGVGRSLNKMTLAKAYYLTGVHKGYVKPTDMQQHRAGPHNPERFNMNEAVAISNKWITKVSGRADIYNAGNNVAQLSADFRNAYGDDAEKIYAFIGDIKILNNDELEICATLYDCWLVRHINKTSCADADIINSFFEYSERKKKFSASKVADMLKWMKKNKITPEHRNVFVGYADQQADADQILMAL